MNEITEFDSAAPTGASKNFPPVVAWADWFLTAIAGLILLLTMTMTVIDVIGRYLFNSPLGFAYEVTELLMATVVFVALPSVTLRSEHITIGLFEGIWTGRAKPARELVIALFIAVCAGFLCYRMFLLTGRFIRYGDNTNILKISLYPLAAVGATGVGLAALAGLALAFDAMRRFMRGAP